MSFALIAMLLTLPVVTEVAERVKWHESFEETVTAAAQSGKPIMAVFTSGGDCGWCSELAGETLVAPEVVEWADRFEAAQVLALRRDDLATRYMVASYPTVVFLSPGGAVLQKVSGYLPPEAFVGIMREVLEAHQALVQARALEAAVGGQEPTPAQLLQIALLYSAASSHERARDWGYRALATGDDGVRPQALLVVGKALVALDEPRRAIELLRELLALQPEGQVLWSAQLQLGYAYLMTDQYSLGRPLLQAVVASAPEGSRERANALRLLEWLDG